MSLITATDLPGEQHFVLYAVGVDPEKRAESRLSGLLQLTASGYLIVTVPTALIRGVFDALHEPGISLPDRVAGDSLRAGIVVMTPEEVQLAGGAAHITERGKPFSYSLGELVETPARNWPGVSTCWHLKVKSPELGQLRRTYGLPTKIEGDSDFSVVVACRKLGVLAANATSKSIRQPEVGKLPDWTLPNA